MKVSVSLPADDIEFLDAYARAENHGSRSSVVHQAIRLLRASRLGDAYEDAWRDWHSSGDAEDWEPATGDGLVP